MSDLIDRQLAIDGRIIIQRTNGVEVYDDEAVPVEYLKRLPSAQPEQKEAMWVRYDGDWLKTMCKCSKCGAMIDINEKYRNFFCYHCGAKMER